MTYLTSQSITALIYSLVIIRAPWVATLSVLICRHDRDLLQHLAASLTALNWHRKTHKLPHTPLQYVLKYYSQLEYIEVMLILT
jgi:hypothetical protein